MEFPEPVISVAVEPKLKADQEKMGIALGKLAQEDPSFRVQTMKKLAKRLLLGWVSLHLDIMVDRMRANFMLNVMLVQPQVAYRESIRSQSKHEHKFVVSLVVVVSMVMLITIDP